MGPPSHTQIDRLGNRLRDGEVDENDLRLLDEYRQSFSDAYQEVVGAVRKLGLHPTGRPVKTTGSIREKLRRETIRLSQIQDIAGCRVIVGNVVEQDEIVRQLTAAFPKSVVFDRRVTPSHDYRAVHVVVHTKGKSIEVQVRTPLQHGWAEVSEKLSDVVDPTIKYGGGSEDLRQTLQKVSDLTAELEDNERRVIGLERPEDELVAMLAKSKAMVTELLEGFVERWQAESK